MRSLSASCRGLAWVLVPVCLLFPTMQLQSRAGAPGKTVAAAASLTEQRNAAGGQDGDQQIRAARPGTNTGSSSSTGPVSPTSGTTTGSSGCCPLPADVTITHNLTVGNELLLVSAPTGFSSGFAADPTATAAVVWTLPPADGVPNAVLTTNGVGGLSWASSPAPANAYTNGGNGFTPGTLGLTSTATLNIITSNKTRVAIDGNGNTTYTTKYKASAYGGNTATQTIVSDPNNSLTIAGTAPYQSYYTAPATGTYLVTTQTCVQIGNTGSKTVQLYTNITTPAPITGAKATIVVPTYSTQGSNTDTYTIPLTTMVHLTIGDQLYLVYGGMTSDTIISDSSFFAVHFMSADPT